jgi:carbon monoxide dehydrogenase subunit G
MLHFEGDREFALGVDEVWAKLSDASFLVQCIPGVESVARSERQAATCVLRPGFAFVRGTLEVTIVVAEAVVNQSVRFDVASKGIGSSSRVSAVLSFAPGAAGTVIHWSADVTELGGLLKAVPPGLLKASAQKVIADIWDAIGKKAQGAS